MRKISLLALASLLVVSAMVAVPAATFGAPPSAPATTRYFAEGSTAQPFDVVPNTAVSARVTTSLPSVAERVMAFVKGGNMGFDDALGVRLQ